MTFPADLNVGDILLYGGADLVDRVIDWKEGEPLAGGVAHIEIYAGNGQSWASRNGIGVNLYPFRPDGLQEVRRPQSRFNLAAVVKWFPFVNGSPYGWSDIAATIDLPFSEKGFDCSHFAGTLLLIAECPQFDAAYPLNRITPRDFRISRESSRLWVANT